MSTTSQAALFTLHDSTLAAATPVPLLGMWAAQPASEAFSFALPDGPSPTPAPVWQVDLPADPAQARHTLVQAEAQLAAADALLAQAPARLRALVGQAQQAADAPLVFGIPGVPTSQSPAEATLLATLHTLAATGDVPTDEHVSYGLGRATGRAEPDRHALHSQVRALADHMRGMVAHYAIIETRSTQQVVSRTTVSWLGDTRTTWARHVTLPQARAHAQTVALTLTSRATLIRTFVVVTRGVAQIGTALATGNALLALPAVWRFVQQIAAGRA